VRLLLASAAIVGASCSSARDLTVYAPECGSDVDCPGSMVCFADGCGDPGRGIVVEVTPSTRSGLYAQDFDVTDAGLTGTMALEVVGPLTLAGFVQREREVTHEVSAYTDGITLTAHGESALLPGIQRLFQATIPRLELGAYQIPIGAGRYDVVARAADTAIPTRTIEDLLIEPNADPRFGASFLFPALDQTLLLTGKVVKYTVPGTPPKPIYLDTQMDIQAFDPITGHALSQPAPISLTGEGAFTLYVDPAAAQLSSVSLVVRPRSADAIAPTKTFVLSPVPTQQQLTQQLEMGNYGDKLPSVTGQLFGTDTHPIVGASVHLEGKVNGGGTFTSATVLTNSLGEFSLASLPSAPGQTFTLIAHPPPESNSGILQALVKVSVDSNYMPKLEPSTLTAPDRLRVIGTINLPSGKPASGVTVVATAIASLDKRPLPQAQATTLSDDSGRYAFSLDPAKYQIEFFPGEQLPRKSRLVRIAYDVDIDAGTVNRTVDLGDFQLSVGRRVSGVVTARAPDGSAPRPAPNATVRFFRVTSVEGVPASLLLAEGISDETGAYTVMLPDHPVQSFQSSP
jgi:hypothetical protein